MHNILTALINFTVISSVCQKNYARRVLIFLFTYLLNGSATTFMASDTSLGVHTTHLLIYRQ